MLSGQFLRRILAAVWDQRHVWHGADSGELTITAVDNGGISDLFSFCLCILTFTAAFPAFAQLELPDAVQGNPLEDKMIGETPDNPFHAIHFFSFDGSIVDEISGVSATPTPGVTHTEGYLGGAIYFDGSGIVQLPIDVSPDAVPELTIIAMIKPAPLPEDPDNNPPAIGYIVSDEDGLIIISNQTKPEPRFEAYSTGAAISSSAHTGIRGGWQMVAITRKVEDRTTDEGEVAPHTVLKLFTNGRTSEAAGLQKQPTIAPKLLLGMKAVNHPYRFRGAIDNLSIYDRALSNDELRDMMAGMRQARMSRRSDVMVAGSGSSEQSTGTSSATMTDDQRSAAAPAAGTAAIGGSSPSFTPPVDTADQTQEFIASEEGQDMLQSADWRIEGMVPNSQDKSTLYPGDEVTLKIRVSKDDAANKIPSVRLVTNVGPGTPSPSYDLTINTAEAKPADERDVPITLPVPETLEFEDGATQLVWRPKVWLNAADGLPLRDAITDNHSRELAIVVLNPIADKHCTEIAQNTDGTQTKESCLEHDETTVTYIDHSVLKSTALPISNAHINDARELLVFDTMSPLLDISIAEVRDKPCDILIGGVGISTTSKKCGDFGLLPSNTFYSGPGDHLNYATPADHVITGLLVCRNSGNDRLKGFQLQVRKVLSDGSLGQNRQLSRQIKQQNCASWTVLSTCPDEHAAAGVQIVWAPGTRQWPQPYIHSIDLMCGAIKVREITE